MGGMGRRSNLYNLEHFQQFRTYPGYKVILLRNARRQYFWLTFFLQNGCIICRHYTEKLALGATRQEQHLLQCQKYLKTQEQAKKRKLDTTSPPTVNPFDKVTPLEQFELDKLAAFMVYDAGLSLQFFDHPAVKAFLNRLRPAYHLFTRTRLSITALNDTFTAIKEEVNKYINIQENLYISFDESNDVLSYKIIDIAVTTEREAFYN
jgi:hypothetical protein